MKSLMIGRGRFPLFPAVRLSDSDLVRNVLVSNPDTELRRRHISEMLSQQTRRGGDWVYYLSTDDRYRVQVLRNEVELLRNDAQVAGREADFMVIDLARARVQKKIGQPGKLCCVILPGIDHEDDIAVQESIDAVCRSLTAKRQNEPGVQTGVPYLVAFDDVLSIAKEHGSPDQQAIAQLVSAVRQSRSANTGFILGAKAWRSPGKEQWARELSANVLNQIAHSGVGRQESEVLTSLSAPVYEELSRQPAGRFALLRRAGVVFGRLTNNLRKVSG